MTQHDAHIVDIMEKATRGTVVPESSGVVTPTAPCQSASKDCTVSN